jgi:hypothetical protein
MAHGGANGQPGSPAERACEFVVTRVRAASGHLFRQGPRKPPLPCRSSAPLLRFFAEERLHRVPIAVARALVAWGDGFPVELFTGIPDPRDVLALQARGARCVSLLPDGASTSPHADALAFAVHDLCHLDKFVDAEHHLGQVGFFSCLDASVAGRTWPAFEASLDEAFRHDWHHVAADMNGSAVFLFAALKMKLKMAVRRRLARSKGAPPPSDGPLTREEARAYDDDLSVLLGILDFEPSIAAAARATSARRDDPGAALRLLMHFEERGRNALRTVSARGLTHD